MPRTRKPKPTDIPEEILDHFAGPARPMSQAEVDTITKRFKKILAERMLGGALTHDRGYLPGGAKPPDLERVHARLRQIIKTRGHFPHDAAATKRIWLALRDITAGRWKAANDWDLPMNQFAILCEDRFTIPRT